MLALAFLLVLEITGCFTEVVSNHTFVILDGEDLILPCLDGQHVEWVESVSRRWHQVENSLYMSAITVPESGIYTCKGDSGQVVRHTVLVLSRPRSLWLSHRLLLPPPSRYRPPCPPEHTIEAWKTAVEYAVCQKRSHCLIAVNISCHEYDDQNELSADPKEAKKPMVSTELRVPVPQLNRQNILRGIAQCRNYSCIRALGPRGVPELTEVMEDAGPRVTEATSRFLFASRGLELSVKAARWERLRIQGHCVKGTYHSHALCLPCRPGYFSTPDTHTGASPTECTPCPPGSHQPHYAAYDCQQKPQVPSRLMDELLESNERYVRQVQVSKKKKQQSKNSSLSDERRAPVGTDGPSHPPPIKLHININMNDSGGTWWGAGDVVPGGGSSPESVLHASLGVAVLSAWLVMLLLLSLIFCCTACCCFPY